MDYFLAAVIWVLIGSLIVASLVPLSKVSHGAIQGLAFPREQFFALATLLFVICAIWMEDTERLVALLLLAAAGAMQLVYIVKFTPLWWRQSIDATEDQAADDDRKVTLLSANVKMSNRRYDRLISLVRKETPDIVMAIETDGPWIEALEGELGDAYEHWVKVPLDNGYGLCLMSKLPLASTEVRELITDKVPSIRTEVQLRGGASFRLYVVHPEPPVLDHDTNGRDGEIALVGMQAAEDCLPAIVSGDLNDVAWSTTTRRFQRLSGLLDPRVGRGFYNTFHADYFFARWPLDHLFHDPQFRLIEMDRLGKIGSDHFPMKFGLMLAEVPAAESHPGDSTPEERAEIEEVIREEKKRNRTAIGSDWEQG